MIDPIDAGTAAFFRATFLDENGAQQAPSAVYATVKSLAPPLTIRAETLLAGPASSMDIAITSAENAAHGNLPVQPRRIVLRVVYGDGDELVTHHDYMVRRV